MFASDLPTIFIWWATIFIISLTVLPLCMNLFAKFIDRGYIFSKIIGILISSYLIWLAGSLHILPFTKISIVLVLIAITLVNLFIFTKKNKQDKVIFPLRWAILEEIIFFSSICFWAFVRGNEPSIRGLEKFMDYGFVTSILRGAYFPPLDMWLTKSPDYTGGFFINYYYFGHYYTAFLTKLSGLDSAVTYNLMIATLYAFTFSLSFSLGANFLYLLLSLTPISKSLYKLQAVSQSKSFKLKLILAGFLTAFLVSLAGNLHTLYTFTTGYPNENPVAFWRLGFGFHPEKYWYPNATRFIPNTIHEFPIYSFVVADLHGHVADIPFVLLTIAILLHLLITTLAPVRQNKVSDSTSANSNFLSTFQNNFRENSPVPLSQLLLLGLLIAVMYMTNAWDGLIYLVLTGLVILYLAAKNKNPQDNLTNIIYKTGSSCLFILFFFLLANFPFMINFRPFVSGIGVLCTPVAADSKLGPFLFEKDHCQRSEFWMMAILWGFFYYNVIGFFAFAIKPFLQSLASKTENLRSRLINLNPVDVYVIIMIFVSTLLLIFPELFYIKDIYPSHYRANTMFKLGYQAFIMLSLVSGYTVFRLKNNLTYVPKSLSLILYNTLYILLFTIVAIYPYFAINSYYGNLSQYRGLDGIVWMRDQYNDDYEAILWLRQNVNCPEGVVADCQNQPVIAEAVKESYTDYARVSAYTGLPTIVGWPVHEWLWRGSYDEAGKRIPEVQILYETTDIEEAKSVIKKYNVAYIFVGALEKEQYSQLNTDKFASLADVIFEQGQTKIFRVKSTI